MVKSAPLEYALTDVCECLTSRSHPTVYGAQHADLEWLHALVSDWQLLADLSFADLLLWTRLREDNGWIAVAQMRPTTGPTAYQDDLVETILYDAPATPGEEDPVPPPMRSKRALIDRAWGGWTAGKATRTGQRNPVERRSQCPGS